VKTKLLVGAAPHIKSPDSIPNIMRTVALALMPAFLWAFYRFGYYTICVTALSVGSAILTEVLCQRLRKVPVSIDDYSAIVTGLLLAAVIPPNVNWYVPVIGSAVAIGIAKHCFGGLGANIWNPALIGRAFLQASFPTEVNSGIWPAVRGRSILNSFGIDIHDSFSALVERAASPEADVITSATPLAELAAVTGTSSHSHRGLALVDSTLQVSWDQVSDAFFGLTFGCIGEVSALALLLGGLFLLKRGIIRWHIPVAYLVTLAVFGFILPARTGSGEFTAWFSGPGLFHVVSGGAMIGAFFMATDWVTNPMTNKGKLIFGCGCGLLTLFIRIYSTAYPEGVCYAILLMNTTVPMIDAWTRPRVFGTKKEETP
jgi:electron transport complex protein RnfD